MSLTSFLKDNAEVRNRIDQTFEKPTVRLDDESLVEPQTTNHALIGTAFDYVLRFWLEERYENIYSEDWVAYTGLEQAQLFGFDVETEDRRTLEQVMIDAEERHQEYLETGEMTDDLLAATLDLARLDWVYRSGRPPENLGKAPEGDIDDLRRLYEVIPEEEFSGADTVMLNPSFGSASDLVNGADADLVLDSALLDMKTVKDATLKIGYWRQLVGYAVLSDTAFDELDAMPRLSEVGIYFSRHGTVWRASSDRIYGQERYDQFKEWFQSEAKDHFSL